MLKNILKLEKCSLSSSYFSRWKEEIESWFDQIGKKNWEGHHEKDSS